MPKISHSSSVIIVNDKDEILLLRRSGTDSWMPLSWDVPGGGIDPGETPEQAAFRETYEETGIELNHIEPFWTRIVSGHTAFIFISFVNNMPPVKLSFEHDKYMWVNPLTINFDLINTVYRVQQCISIIKDSQ